jgi:branched-chain amino acid transport system permease protein
VFLGLEEVLKGWTEHWMVIFGPLIVLMALVGRRGIVGLIALRPKSRRPATPVVASEGGV